jgi:hypothetical protein
MRTGSNRPGRTSGSPPGAPSLLPGFGSSTWELEVARHHLAQARAALVQIHEAAARSRQLTRLVLWESRQRLAESKRLLRSS